MGDSPSIPIVFQLASGMGLDRGRFGIIVVLAVELALIVPPMGIDMFVTRGLAVDVSLAQVFLGVLPFCAVPVALFAPLVTVPRDRYRAAHSLTLITLGR